MATLKSTIKIDSSDFFSTKLNIATSNTTLTSGDDRAFSVEKVAVGVNAFSTITQTVTAISGMRNKTILFTDNQQNKHTITFSDSYSKYSGGNKASTSLTVSSAATAWNGKTLVLIDNNGVAARTVTITFNNTTTTLVRQAGATSTAISYAAGVTTGGTQEAIRDKIVAHLVAIKAAGDLDIDAVVSGTNVNVITLTQSYVGSGGNTAVTGTVDDSTAVTAALTAFTTGGLGYTSSYAGISDNAATTTAHLTSLKNSLSKAISEGKLNMSVGATPTASTFIVSMSGPYVADNNITLSGTAITTSSTTTATSFAGAGTPEVLPCGEFNSKFNKVYFYGVNKSSAGVVNVYHREAIARSAGSLIVSKVDTTDLNDGGSGVMTLISPKGLSYTFTIVAAGAVTANTRVSDLAYHVGMSAASDVFMNNLIETISLVDNKSGREKRPFEATVAVDDLSLSIRSTDLDTGVEGNTVISQNYTGGTLTVTDADFTGGVDRYHLIARLGPGEHIYMPFAGFPKLYLDAETSVCEVEFLTIEA